MPDDTLASGMTMQDLLTQSGDNQRVRIGDVWLGERRETAPDTSKPNPESIDWSQEFLIIEHKRVGMKPLTQCIEVEALWVLDITFNTLDNDEEVLKPIINMKAGPHWIRTAYHDVCMYLVNKKIQQVKGTKDWYQKVILHFKEANDG